MKKNNWLSRNLLLVCAVLWFVIALLQFLAGKMGMAMTWAGIGSLYLILFFVQKNKRREDQWKEEKDQFTR